MSLEVLQYVSQSSIPLLFLKMSYTDEQSQFLVDAWQAGHISVSAELERALSEAMANVQLRESTFFDPSSSPEPPRPSNRVRPLSSAHQRRPSGSSRSQRTSSQPSRSQRSTPDRQHKASGSPIASPINHFDRESNARRASAVNTADGVDGATRRRREGSTSQLKNLKTLQLEAMAFEDKPLPATPDQAGSTPVELFHPEHKHTRSASSGRILPSPIQPLERSLRAKGDPLIRQSAIQALRPVDKNLSTLGVLARLPPSTPKLSDSSTRSTPKENRVSQSLQRTDSVITLQSPEQTCWKNTAYTPGEIKLQKLGMQRPDSTIGFGTNGGVVGFDLFKDLHDDRSSIRTRQSEIGVIDDVLSFVESYGFDPVSFEHDEFWLKDTTSFHGTLDLFDHISPSSSTYSPTSPRSPPAWSVQSQSPLSPSRRLSNGLLSKYTQSPSVSHFADRGRDSWNLYGSGAGPRTLQPSPSPPLPPPKTGSERGRPTGRPVTRNGKDSRIGMMRLLKGAGSIV